MSQCVTVQCMIGRRSVGEMGEEGSNTLTKEVSMLLLLHCHKGLWMAQYLFHQFLCPRSD